MRTRMAVFFLNPHFCRNREVHIAAAADADAAVDAADALRISRSHCHASSRRLPWPRRLLLVVVRFER